jgi:predicted HAD superfamily Cof-like phosphohydrolase
MNNKMHGKILLFVAFLISAMNVSAADLVADVEALPDTISLYPQVPYAQLELTVAGNDVYWQKIYGPGEVATFSTMDKALPDGQYRFELIASPAYDEEAWEYAREDPALKHELDVLERAETYRQTGRFEVLQGQIVLTTDADGSSVRNRLEE